MTDENISPSANEREQLNQAIQQVAGSLKSLIFGGDAANAISEKIRSQISLSQTSPSEKGRSEKGPSEKSPSEKSPSEKIPAGQSAVGINSVGRVVSEFKIYELVQAVTKSCDYPWSKDTILALFQKQFITQAALCELYFDIASETDHLVLLFTPVSVCLVYKTPLATLEGAVSGLSALALEENYSPNIAFYLDYHNFFSATPASVNEMLRSFWRKYETYMEKSPALKLLGLEEGADWASIQSRYRTLARQNHPDKGGDANKFIEIRQAFEALKRLHLGV
ncbi:Chaperone protein DnaJ [Thalassocella blandensis]|nr:Chaperone protein DnaJ [Thalassocella blandensis]